MTTLFLFLAMHVRGVVVDPAARPVEGAKVSCGPETVTTDAHGQFDFPDAGRCDVIVTKDGFGQKNVRIDDSRENSIALALAPASDRVVVTATGSPVAIEEAGVSASVYTSRDFSARQNPFLEDYLRDAPGLSVVQTGRNGGLTTLFARGGDSSATLVLLDGVPLTDPGGAIDVGHLTTAGIDRMEVVRGPESALFGAEASSAVIQLFTRHGDAETNAPHGSLTYERGSFSTDHWNASLDGGFLKRIDYFLTADQFRTTGEFPNDTYRITSGTANIGYRFSDRTSLHAIFREFDSFTGAPGQVFYGAIDHDANESARDAAVSVRLDDARGRRFVERVLFGYHRNRDLYKDEIDDGPWNVAALLRTVGPFVYLSSLVSPATTVAPPGTTLSKQMIFDFTGDSQSIADRTDASYQGTLTHSGGALVFGYNFERQAGVISSTSVARYDNGWFVYDQYALTPRIFLSGGARFEQSSTFGSKFAPRGAITFRLPTETFLRVSAARGITEPSLVENFARESFYVGNPALRPEKTTSFEAGLFREWFNRRVRTDVALFRNAFSDLIEFDFSNFPGTWQNINRSWARGIELSGVVKLNKYASVRAAYTRLYTRIVTSNNGDLGQELLRQPRNSGSISFELAPRRWTLVAGARFVGERQDSDFVFGINRNPGYEYVFLSGSWQATRHVAPFIRIQNAANELYQEALGYSSLARTTLGGVRLTW
jgi:vitamin B12 transporter